MPDLALPAFSALTAAAPLRNLAGPESLAAWLDQIALSKLGPPEERGARESKAAAWLGSVAKNALRRDGLAFELSSDSARELIPSQPWIEKALAAGQTIHQLALSEPERESLLETLDWLRADTGPSLTSDWSRMSLAQASDGHREWVERSARQAQKRASHIAAMEGCEIAAPILNDPAREGWAWVKVLSAKALDREGAMMRHCVGSYAQQVEDDELAIWSLRDAEGRPHLTVETQNIAFAAHPPDLPALGARLKARDDAGASRYPVEAPSEESKQTPIARRLEQIKAVANKAASPDMMAPIQALIDYFEASGAPATEAGLDLFKAGAGLTPPGFGSAKLWLRASPEDAALAASKAQELPGPRALPLEKLADIAGFFGSLGYAEAFKKIAPRLKGAERSVALMDRFSTIASTLGLALGSGHLAGRVFERGNPADQAACEALALASEANTKQDALIEARLLQQLGFEQALQSSVEKSSARFGPSFISELNAGFTREGAKVRAGEGEFNTQTLWRSDPISAQAAEEIARKLMSCPEQGSKELIARQRAALRLCANLGFHQAAETLAPCAHSKASDDQRKETLAALHQAGYVFEDSLNQQLCTPSPDSAKRALAAAQALRAPDMDTLSALLGRARFLGHEEASSALCALIPPNEQKQMIQRLIELGANPPASLLDKTELNLSELESLTQLCMGAGLTAAVKKLAPRVAALPDSAFESDEQLARTRLRYKMFTECADLCEKAVGELLSSPSALSALSAPLSHAALLDAPRTLEPLPSLYSLREGFTVWGEASLTLGFGMFAERLKALAPPALVSPVHGGLSFNQSASRTLAQFFVYADINEDQRRAIIGVITGYSKMEASARSARARALGQ